MIETTCAWCGKWISGPRGAAPENVSHGICPECLEREFPEKVKKSGPRTCKGCRNSTWVGEYYSFCSLRDGRPSLPVGPAPGWCPMESARAAEGEALA
jgi:hypothetical protein